MKTTLYRVFVLLIVLCAAGVSRAQNASLPLVMEYEGDIYTWKSGDAALTRLTTWGYNSDLVISPDGTLVAYYSLPQVVVDAIQREGGFGGGKLPGNIWVMDTVTGEAYRAGSQPDDASFATQGVPDKAIVRSTPMWSPDGSQLAWTEYDYPENASSTLRLVIFDTATKWQKTVADDVPFPAGVPSAMDGLWTDAGLFLNHYEMDTTTGMMSNVLLVYSPDGKLLNQVRYDESNTRILSMSVPAAYQNSVQLAALVADTTTTQRAWQMVDPLTDGAAWQPAPAVPAQVAVLNPDHSVKLSWISAGDGTSYADSATIVKPDGVAVNTGLADGTWISQPVLSPDGKEVAFRSFDPKAPSYDPAIYVLDTETGVVQTVPVPASGFVHQIVWGAMKWIIPG